MEAQHIKLRFTQLATTFIKLKVQLLLVIENDLPTCIMFYCAPLQLRILNFRYLLVHQFRH